MTDIALPRAPRARSALSSEPISRVPGSAVRAHHLPVPDSLRPIVSALVGVEMDVSGPTPLAIAPHESLVLSLQFARGRCDPIGPKADLGLGTSLTGIRQWTGSFVGAGDCVTLFALLTPVGAVQLLDSRRLDQSPRIRAPLAHLLDEGVTRPLESRIALVHGLPDKLRAFGHWLESRAAAWRQQDRTAMRAARAAMRVLMHPLEPVDRLADEQHVSRRQLERDLERWVGVSPHHLAQVARVQGVARDVYAGASLADAAAGQGFTDQPHMNRVVRKLTGLTPRQFVRSRMSPFGEAFRAATGGATVYL